MTESPATINPWRLFHGVFVPNWLARMDDVSAGAKLCYGRLCQYAGRGGVAEPDQDELGAELGVGDRMVRRYLGELVDKALVRVERVGLNHPNRYEFLAHPAMGMSALDRNDSSAPDRNDGSAPTSVLESIDTRVDVFEAAWSSYPRKVNKVGARKAWNARINAGNDADAMTRAARNYASWCEREGTDERFVMHGATFFGPSERWLEFVDKEVPSRENPHQAMTYSSLL